MGIVRDNRFFCSDACRKRYWQDRRAIEKGGTATWCQHCGRKTAPFFGREKRRDTKYCSQSCRSAAYRARRARPPLYQGR
jgi:hypothetical protein